MLARTPMMLSSSSAACAAVGRVTGKSATATTMPPGASEPSTPLSAVTDVFAATIPTLTGSVRSCAPSAFRFLAGRLPFSEPAGHR